MPRPRSKGVRCLILLLFLLMPLAGCIDGGSKSLTWSQESENHGFVARYETEGGHFLELSMDRVEVVADANLRPKAAFAVDLQTNLPVLTQSPGNMPPRSEANATIYLDATGRLVRFDGCLGFELCFDNQTQVSWRGHGSYPPLGIGLENLAENGIVEYLVAGEFRKSRLVETNGWTTMVDGLNPGEILTASDSRFQFDNQFVPLTIDIAEPWSDVNRILLHRVHLESLGTIPLADDWKLLASDAPMPPRGVVFDGEGQEAFRTGIRFIDGYDEILRQSAKARQASEDGCLSHYFFYWGGGYRVGLPVVGDLLRGDVAKVQVALIDGKGVVQTWEVQYEQGTPLTAYEPSNSEQQWASEEQFTCPKVLGGIGTADDFLADAWALPRTQSGVPCDLGVHHQVYWFNASAVPRAPMFMAHLMRAGEDGNP